MIKDGMFLSSDVTVENLSELSDRQCELEELRICELSALADSAVEFTMAMSREGYEIYEILSLISEGYRSSDDFPAVGSLEDNLKNLRAYLKITSSYDKIVFSKLLLERMKKSGMQISEASFLQTGKGNGVFTYVKNSLADEAYDVFSQDFEDPRVKYSHNFKEACALVSSGECEYSVLPLEEKGGVRLFSVASLLFSEDLKINSVIPVFGMEGNADMKYALVSRHFTVPEILPDDDRYLELRLRVDSSIPLSEILVSADSMGANVYRVNTVAFNTEEGPIYYYSLVFKDDGEDFSNLLIYLTLFSDAYTVVGIYKNLE